MKWRITNIILAIVVLGLSGTGLAQAASETKYIRDDATGGDCTSIGMWDLSTKTCTLTMDLSDSIAIVGDGITLDGNGHTITDSDVCIDFSISLGGSSGSNGTIKNLTMIQCGVGVFTELSNTTVTNSLFYDNGTAFAARGTLSFTIAKNVLSNNGTGIRTFHVAGGLIADNTIVNNGYGIYLGPSVNGVTIIDNIVSRNDYGISIGGMGNIVKNNTISYNLTTGIRVSSDWGGWGGIYNNNFIDNPSPQIETITFSFPVVFNLDVPIGGNYWSEYHTPAQGCDDLNNDGFCDEPYVFDGGQDNLPWTSMNGWLVLDVNNLIADTERACNQAWISKLGICKSLDAKLNAAKASIERGQFDTAQNQLNAFINELDAQKGKAINQQAYDLLKADVMYVMEHLP